MTITLLEDVASGQSLVAVTNPTTARLDQIFQIDSEYVVIRNRPRGDGKLVLGRGFLGSTRTTHAADVTLTPVQLVVQTDAPTAPPPATAGGATAQVVFVGAVDPGAIGVRNIWVRTDADYGLQTLFVRNETDDGWLGYGDAIDKALAVYGIDGENPTPTAAVYVGATPTPGGGVVNAYVQTENETQINKFLLNRTGVQLTFGTKGMKADANGVGFNDATPVIPVIPAVPTAQNVADALVALGLVTQAS